MIAALQPRAERYRFLPREPAVRSALPWIISLMVFLAVLGVAAGIGLGSGVGVIGEDLSRQVTVQIADPNPDRLPQKTAALAERLSASGDVERVEVLAEPELEALLEPWLGSGDLGDTLPLPVMIDVTVAPDVDMGAFARELEALDPAIAVDDHLSWFAPIGRLAAVLAATALLAALLIAAATAAMVVLGVRAGLGRHRNTIAVLHLMGAEDRTIAELFQYRLAMTAFAGAFGGFLAALVVLFGLGALIGQIGSGLIGAATLPPWGWLLLLMVPVGAVLLSMTTARVTVERTLRQEL